MQKSYLHHPPSKQAFSLVELSIVLVILGLLTGGILAGQSLIRAAELRAVVNEYQRYSTAVQSFRDKYLALPGDMNNASRFWNRMNNNADCVTNSAASVGSTGTCDGNGDGDLDLGNQGQSSERFQFWRQLALAGLIEGSYNGLYGASGAPALNELNSPKSKLSNAHWQSVKDTTAITGHSGMFDLPALTSYFQIGVIYVVDGAGNRNPVFRPEEAWNIDTKIDDGRPALGNFRARTNESTQAFSECTTAANGADSTAQYQLTSTQTACAALFLSGF